jgi:hypothetical protein
MSHHDYVGMPLLDHFAGQALAGLAGFYAEYEKFADLAEDCYDIADAMLSERERRMQMQSAREKGAAQ